MSGLSRRGFLRSGVGVATAGAVIGAGSACSNAPQSQASSSIVPFHGSRQAAILREPQPHCSIFGARVTAANRRELTDLMRSITARAAMLTSDTIPAADDISAPADDSGTLGPRWATDCLTISVGVGHSLFDDRYGLSALTPHHLVPMATYADDNLDPQWCHGDLVLMFEAARPDVISHAVRDVTRHTRGALAPMWRRDGFTPPARPSGAARNHFGFKDGIANPNPANDSQMRQLVWAGADDQPWTAGGSYLTVRLIRMLVEFWDRIAISEQQNIFGRDRRSGAPLTGTVETDVPDYSDDPNGSMIALTSHIRLANPRTRESAGSQFLRRSYSYDAGIRDNGTLDVGLIFLAYQNNIGRQFDAVQKRLDGESLADYISPFGGGHFFMVPGVTDSTDYFGRALLA